MELSCPTWSYLSPTKVEVSWQDRKMCFVVDSVSKQVLADSLVFGGYSEQLPS